MAFLVIIVSSQVF